MHYSKLILSVLIMSMTLLLITSFCIAQEISAEKITEDVLVINSGLYRMTAVNTEEGILIVDTLRNPNEAAAAKELILQHFGGKRICYVVNTHHNWDHVFGNEIFEDAVIIAHVNSANWMEIGRQRRCDSTEKNIANLKKNYDAIVDKESEEAKKMSVRIENLQGDLETYRGVDLIPATIKLIGEAELSLGNKTIKLLHFGPGHTDNDLVILVVEDRVLILGDLIFSKMVPYVNNYANADFQNWIATLDKLILMSQAYNVAIPGHGEIGTVDIITNQKAYMSALWKTVSEYHKTGKPLEKAQAEIDMSKFTKGWLLQGNVSNNIEACWAILEQDKKQ